jgi:hypothetical protein
MNLYKLIFYIIRVLIPFSNALQSGMLDCKESKGIRKWRKVHNEDLHIFTSNKELHNLWSLHSTVNAIILRKYF